MKTKALLVTMVIFMIIVMSGVSVNASFSDVPPNASYIEELNRVSALRIIDGDHRGMFRPNSYITREQFVKIVVKTMGNDEEIEKYQNKSKFKDVSPDRWSSKFISYAVDKGLINGREPGIFDPMAEVNFAEACTIMVNYLKSDKITSPWPRGYISAARELDLTEDLSFDPKDKVPRWAATVMIDKFWITNIKNRDSYNFESIDISRICIDAIVLGNSTTNERLTDTQVLTDKGVFYVMDKDANLGLGKEYKIFVYEDTLVKVYESLNKVKSVTVKSHVGTDIGFVTQSGEVGELTLPIKSNYYNDGKKISYEALDNILSKSSSVVLGYNNDETDFEYAVVFNPQYSKYEIARDKKESQENIGNISFSDNKEIIREENVIEYSEIEKNDVLYNISDIWESNSYILVVSEKGNGKINKILPNKLTPKSIVINGASYNFSEDLDTKEARTKIKEFDIDDSVTALLGYDNKIVDIVKGSSRSGPYIECTIIGDSRSSRDIRKDQVLTDKGTYYLYSGLEKLELGGKYKVVIDNDTIVKIHKNLKSPKYYTIENIVDNKISYIKDGSTKEMLLPDKTTYYHNGMIKSYNQISILIKLNTTIAFVENDINSGYEYGVIYDPWYSDPEVLTPNNLKSSKFGNIQIEEGTLIIKDDEIIKIDELEEKQVIYNVINVLGENPYVLVIDNNIQGKITDIKPNKLAPQIISVNGVDYNISEFLDRNKINYSKGAFKDDNHINLLLGYDNKVIDIYSEDFNYAIVINYNSVVSDEEEDFGKKKYYAKLLMSEGNTYTYEVDKSAEMLKGLMVSFNGSDSGIFQLEKVDYMGYEDMIVDKSEKTLNSQYVADNSKIFNILTNKKEQDAEVEVLEWKDVKRKIIPGAKIRYMYKGGSFNDIKLIVINDLYDSDYRLGYIKSIAETYTVNDEDPDFKYNVIYDGKVSVTNKLDEEVKIGDVHKMRVDDNTIRTVYDEVEPIEKTTRIQAIDSGRIMVNEKIYKLSEDLVVYVKNDYEENDDDSSYTKTIMKTMWRNTTKVEHDITTEQKISTVKVDNIDTKKVYENVLLYMNRDISDGGEVETIVIWE